MTLSSTHARERSVRRRRTSRAVARVALVVLLGQVILPHLHALQTGAHAATTDARAHRAAARLHDAPVAIECAASPAEREHSESRCPVCQTLAHAHDFLPTTSSHPALAEAMKARVEALRAADPSNRAPIPSDLVTASASGLDPHVTLAGAQWQIGRVARARGLSPERVRALVEEHAELPFLGVLGEPRVNVLRLNLALDKMG